MNRRLRILVFFLALVAGMFGIQAGGTLLADLLLYHRLKHVQPLDWLDYLLTALSSAFVPLGVAWWIARKKEKANGNESFLDGRQG